MENPPIPAAIIEPEQDLGQSDNILASTLPGKEPPAPHERASQLRPEDLIPKQHVERYDTFDSLPSTFGPRTNTGFSVATTATDYTEPDLTTLNDDEGEGTPALRSFAFPSCPSDGLPSFPPTRVSSFAPDGRDTARGEGDDLPGPSNPISFRPGPSSERDQEPGPSRRGTAPLPDDSHAVEPSATDSLHIKVEMTREDSDLTQTDHTLSPKGESEADTSTQSPERDVVENVCDQVLRDAFHLGLEELAISDAAAEAYEATRYFLDELSRIVPTNSAPVWAPSQSQMTRDPGGYGQSQGSSPSQGNGNGGGHGSRQNGGGNKRRSSDDADDQNQDGYDDGYGSGGNGKRPRTDGQPHEDQYLSCPFRKRNPVKFNVRDFLSCATQSFPDVSQLKRHVKLFHKQKSVSGHACPRCKIPLGSKAAVDRHLAVPRDQVCESQTSPSSQDPEDGINAKTEDLLNGRRANTKVDTWDILWKTLFPNDDPSDLPHPEFIPPIELEEVHSDFHLPSTVSSLRTLLDSAPDLSPDALLPVITHHIDQVFRSCRHQKTGSSHPPRRRRQQRPKSTTVTSPTAPTPTDITLRPVPFPYDHGTPGGDSSPGSAISGGGGSWYLHSQHPHLTSFHGHDMLAVGPLTTSSSNASAILSPAVGGDLSPAAFGGDSLSPSPADFDGTPMFPALTTHQFRGGYGGGGGMGFNGGAGDRMLQLQIATSMPMHPHPLPSQQGLGDDMGPTTAIDRSGGMGSGGIWVGMGATERFDARYTRVRGHG